MKLFFSVRDFAIFYNNNVSNLCKIWFYGFQVQKICGRKKQNKVYSKQFSTIDERIGTMSFKVDMDKMFL